MDKLSPPLTYPFYIYIITHYNSLFIIDLNYSSDEDEIDLDTLKFSITFSPDEWENIRPQNKIYYGKNRTRHFEILAPLQWSHLIQEHFYLHTKLPCSITYKHARVKSSENINVVIDGKYTECGSLFYGEIKNIPKISNR